MLFPVAPHPFPELSPTSPVTKEALLPYRLLGDPLADSTIEAIFSTGPEGLAMVHRLLKHLVLNDHPLVADPKHDEVKLPPHVVEHIEAYFRASDQRLLSLDAVRIEAGEKIFRDHGPEILLLLATYSLPASYTARRGAQVLAQTGRLESQPVRRLIETTQMVIDVMSKGGLEIRDDAKTHGKGIRSTQKVRLMHAAIRRLILSHGGEEWVKEYGVPINQMDLCGTLMTFSSVIMDGLAMLGVRLSPKEQEDYLYAWTAVGSILGVREELIPESVERARTFTAVIREAEIGKSPQGIALTRALIKALKERCPPLLGGLPIALMRRFLKRYGDVLDLPRAGPTSILVSLLVGLSSLLDSIHRSFHVTRWLHRKFSNVLIHVFLRFERGGSRPSFEIPSHLADGWGIRK